MLPELSTDKAAGEVRNIYGAIEAALGVRLVNLVYRHLATVPGALEWAWYTVGAPFQAGVFADRSKTLIPAAAAAPDRCISLVSAGLSVAEAGRVLATLDAYNRANPMNALSLRVIALALEAGRPAAAVPIEPPPPVELPELLPMASLDGMEAGTRDTMQRLARLTTGRDTRIVPSLFRHFAPWPELLNRLAGAMEEMAAAGVIDDQSSQVIDKAETIAFEIFQNLPPPPAGAVLPDRQIRKTLVETIEIFPPTICRMIVIAGLLRSAMVIETATD